MLDRAREAQAEAESLIDNNDLFEYYSEEFDRLIALYQISMTARAGIEEAARIGNISSEKLVQTILSISGRYVTIALQFEISEEWTLCIYRAETFNQDTVLRCIGHQRAIQCSLENARVWKAGTGIAGVAFANRNEVVIPDMQTEGLAAVYGSGANAKKDEDAYRYRSMAAVPIVLGKDEVWGIVTATSDNVGHFRDDVGSDVVGTVEPLRALANMIALALACVQTDSPKKNVSQPRKRPVAANA